MLSWDWCAQRSEQSVLCELLEPNHCMLKRRPDYVLSIMTKIVMENTDDTGR